MSGVFLDWSPFCLLRWGLLPNMNCQHRLTNASGISLPPTLSVVVFTAPWHLVFYILGNRNLGSGCLDGGILPAELPPQPLEWLENRNKVKATHQKNSLAITLLIYNRATDAVDGREGACSRKRTCPMQAGLDS